MKIGMGYDIHRFKKGRPLILGGVRIKHPKGLDGHSDADVLAHAVMDALLGASGLGDIGLLFPNTDPAYAGASSIGLLKKVSAKVRKRGYKIVNLDSVIVAEEPKISPFASTMTANIARAVGVRTADVSVKATTNERLGAIGGKKGMAAFAVCLLK
jgi:2-C-methyl-D-erythritol 2,4-cyclodiphosphate synthase